MSERPFMQLYVSDFIGDTLQLSTEQIGAYMLLLMAMWNAGGKLPADDAKLARVTRMSLKKWASVSADLMPFFEIEDGVIYHNRLTKELQKSESKSQSRASAGAAGGAAKALKDKEARVANAMPTSQHLPDTITREDSSSLRSEENARVPKVDFKAEFESEFWPIYPHKVGKPVALASFLKARQRAPLDVIIPGLRRYVAKTDDRPWCNASTWLNQDRWDDLPAQVARGQPPPRERDLADIFNDMAKQDYHDDGRTIEGSYEHRDFDGAGQALPRLAAPPRQS
ncbi:DUF1376 domain-containing protein [Rhizobium laguerreae]|uniref:YdaU family protein n=1 Tax=Rhizobium laguerreae TaxID=1076926 RepID=UPI001C904769|nr:DUF1376 domain-containing protein [Rhizobium laguerreae]MBY3162100.1 DUF1376 domain-containing protein [Rhizobium laguerreae]